LDGRIQREGADFQMVEGLKWNLVAERILGTQKGQRFEPFAEQEMREVHYSMRYCPGLAIVNGCPAYSRGRVAKQIGEIVFPARRKRPWKDL